ncbi:MAG: flippase-like domain-containing protein [Patescibacteria group bacterium]|nr:flippase-like domain-containing protein [Patescibacteria group bacterium]
MSVRSLLREERGKLRDKSKGSPVSRVLKVVLPVIVIAAAVVVIYPRFRSEWPNIASVLLESDKTLLVILLFMQSAIYLFDGSLSYTLLSILERKVQWLHAVRIAILSAISGKILPIVGNTITTYFFYGKLNVKLREVLFVVFSWNILYTVNFLFFFGLALLFAPAAFLRAVHPVGFWIAITVFFGVVAGILILLKNHGRNLIEAAKYLSSAFNVQISVRKVTEFLDNFYEDVRMLGSKKPLAVRALFLSSFYYLSNVVILYFSFVVFHYHPSFVSVILGFNFSTILALITFVPEVPGVTEASMALVFVGFGYPAHIAVLTSVLYRLVSYWVLLPLGAHSYYRLTKDYGRKKGN